MGVVHSTETSVLTAVILTGVLGFGYYNYYMTPTEGDISGVTSSSADGANSVKNSKKKKKKKKSGLEASTSTSDKRLMSTILSSSSTSSQLVDSSASSSSYTIPGQFDQQQHHHPLPIPSGISKIKKPKKRTVKRLSTTSDGKPSSSSTIIQQQHSSSHTTKSGVQQPSTITTEGSWTRVESRRKQGGTDDQSIIVDITTSDAGLTSSVTDNSSPLEEAAEAEAKEEAEEDEDEDEDGSTDKFQTLAEKLVPKTPQTKIDDMLPDYNQPTLSRVMRVQPLPDEKPASGFSWRDYEDVDADGEDDDGWEDVKSKRSLPQRETHASTSTSTSSALPAGGGQTQTQRQRQNVKRRETQKATKAAAETNRLATLAKHKHELEKARIIEQSRSAGKTGRVSGGMTPVVDTRGKMVWE